MMPARICGFVVVYDIIHNYLHYSCEPGVVHIPPALFPICLATHS
jgi:hypothetical protein